MVVKPQSTVAPDRKIGNNIPGAHLYTAVLHIAGLGPQDFKMMADNSPKQNGADNAVKVGSGYDSFHHVYTNYQVRQTIANI
jgi:hypothetical protein